MALHRLCSLLLGLFVLPTSCIEAFSVNRSLQRLRFAHNARSLPFPSKPLLARRLEMTNTPNERRRRKGGRRQIKSIGSSSGHRKSKSSQQRSDRKEDLELSFARWLRKVWKGMTLPFPKLRDLGLQVENGNTGVGLSIQECILAIATYLMAGVIAFCFVFEKWSIVDALYFSVTTFTTVGTGDVVPTTPGGQAFTCIFGLGGIAFLGITIATLGTHLISTEMEAVKMAERASRKRVMEIFDGMPSPNDEHTVDKETVTSTMSGDVELETVQLKNTARETLLKSIPAFTFLFLGGVLMGAFEDWEWPTALYYSVITAGTIGKLYIVVCDKFCHSSHGFDKALL